MGVSSVLGLCVISSSFSSIRNSFTDILRAILLSLEVLIENPELQINGFILIIDWSNFSFKQASKLTPNILKLAIEGLQVRKHSTSTELHIHPHQDRSVNPFLVSSPRSLRTVFPLGSEESTL